MIEEMEELGVSEIRKIITVVDQKYGYDFSNYAISSFTRRIERMLQVNKINYEELVNRIKDGHLDKEEFLGHITVNVTEMFRDPSFWKAIKNIIEDIAVKREKIRIWHAGCSSGEEVFSMMILLSELKLLNRSEILAIDIDAKVLKKAESGKLAKNYFDINRNNYLNYAGSNDLHNYFAEEKDFYKIEFDLSKYVAFREFNLVKERAFYKFDLILCRNVFIYFNNTLQNEVLCLLANSLFSEGYLAIGSKESITACKRSDYFKIFNLEEKIFTKMNPVNTSSILGKLS